MLVCALNYVEVRVNRFEVPGPAAPCNTGSSEVTAETFRGITQFSWARVRW